MDEDGNGNMIFVVISSFETDNPSSSAVGLSSYLLFPCETLEMAIALEHHTLLNRAQSRCRNEFPPSLKKMIVNSLSSDLFYSPILVRDLPYDKMICERLCSAQFHLPKCGCYINIISWIYAGKPVDLPVCPIIMSENDSCTAETEGQNKLPMSLLNECQCYPKCDYYEFRVVGVNKIRYSYGKSTGHECNFLLLF